MSSRTKSNSTTAKTKKHNSLARRALDQAKQSVAKYILRRTKAGFDIIEAPYPEYIIVLPNNAKAGKIEALRASGQNLVAIVSEKQARSVVETGTVDATFTHKRLYRRHFNVNSNKYYTLRRFPEEMQRDMVHEILTIADHLRVQKVEIQGFRYQSKRRTTIASCDGTLGLRDIVNAEAFASVNTHRTINTTSASLIAVEYAKAGYNDTPYPTADVIPEPYVDHGFHFLIHNSATNELRNVAATLLEKGTCSRKELKVSFCVSEIDKQVFQYSGDIQTALQNLAKCGVAVEKSDERDMALQNRFELTIAFWESTQYEKWWAMLSDSRTETHQRLRNVVAEVASLRYDTPLESQALVCCDLEGLSTEVVVAERDRSGVPAVIAPTNKYANAIMCCLESCLGPSDQNPSTCGDTHRIPVVLYGPEGAGRTSALHTWHAAVHETAFSFIMRDKYMIYRDRVKQLTPAVLNLAARVALDPKYVHHKHGQAVKPNDDYKVVLDVHDTYPAKDYTTQLEKRRKETEFPTGTMVLVLDATKIAGWYETEEDPQTGDVSVTTLANTNLMNYAKAYCRTVDDKNPRDYPPFAILLAKSNLVDAWDDPDVHEEHMKWVKRALEVDNVFPMPTFSVPAATQIEEYKKGNALEFGSYRHEYRRTWDKTMLGALAALASVFECLLDTEKGEILRRFARDREYIEKTDRRRRNSRTKHAIKKKKEEEEKAKAKKKEEEGKAKAKKEAAKRATEIAEADKAIAEADKAIAEAESVQLDVQELKAKNKTRRDNLRKRK